MGKMSSSFLDKVHNVQLMNGEEVSDVDLQTKASRIRSLDKPYLLLLMILSCTKICEFQYISYLLLQYWS